MRSAAVITLDAWDGEAEQVFADLIGGDGDCGPVARGQWFLVDLVSQSSKPFEAHLAWTAGGGGALAARISVARAARVGLFARACHVRVSNLAAEENIVSGNFADARVFVQTHNQYEVRGYNATDGQPYEADLPIPPFATHLSVYVADSDSDLGNWYIRFKDGQGNVISSTALTRQPPGGFEVGGASAATLYCNVELGRWRAIYTLSL
jgi:hypothetical protein